mmetsp:Transcript_23956/g.80916  ORF Transcript_23956/g.80916 Transcript_23956/m.80916 type:complete len:243 (+) Transcript_23956:250-978(+)
MPLKTAPPLHASGMRPLLSSSRPMYDLAIAFGPLSLGCDQTVVWDGTHRTKTLCARSLARPARDQREAWPSRKRKTGWPPLPCPGSRQHWRKCSIQRWKSSSVIDPFGETASPMCSERPSSASSSSSPSLSAAVGSRTTTSSPALRFAAAFLAPPAPPRDLMTKGARSVPSEHVVTTSVTWLLIRSPSAARRKTRPKPSACGLNDASTVGRPLAALAAASSTLSLHSAGTSAQHFHGILPWL